MGAWSTGSDRMPRFSHRFILNLLAMGVLATGALASLFVPVQPELQGALWGALIAWLAATKANGT